jgi:hypothetical protein
VPASRLLACLAIVATCALPACKRDAATTAAPATQAPAPATPPAARAPILHDVIERDPRYMIGISYPPIANRHPGLARALQRYADAARAELMQAVAGIGNQKPAAPYDLSLAFTQLAATPDLIAIAADGSSYTGGAHGNPLVARFVWLPKSDRALTITDLVPERAAWADIARQVRAQLHAALAQRVDADALPPAERADVMRDAGHMIDEGTEADPANFSQFEPLLGADGRIVALRFVFAPYQVGPYADGTQTVDLPADVLLPHIAPAWRGLFAGG